MAQEGGSGSGSGSASGGGRNAQRTLASTTFRRCTWRWSQPTPLAFPCVHRATGRRIVGAVCRAPLRRPDQSGGGYRASRPLHINIWETKVMRSTGLATRLHSRATRFATPPKCSTPRELGTVVCRRATVPTRRIASRCSSSNRRDVTVAGSTTIRALIWTVNGIHVDS